MVKRTEVQRCIKDIKEADWLKLYQDNYNSVIELSLRAFQYQTLLRAISTKNILARCSLVLSIVETIEHLFSIYPSVKHFGFKF